MKTYLWDSLRCVNYFKIVSVSDGNEGLYPQTIGGSLQIIHTRINSSPRNFELHYFNKANIYAVCRCVDFVGISYQG